MKLKKIVYKTVLDSQERYDRLLDIIRYYRRVVRDGEEEVFVSEGTGRVFRDKAPHDLFLGKHEENPLC